MNFIISDHASIEIQRRKIRLEDVKQVLNHPQQVIPVRQARKIHQSIIEMDGKSYLLRLIVDEGDTNILVTVYRTSKIQKYWRQS
jgi:hypothetical protein